MNRDSLLQFQKGQFQAHDGHLMNSDDSTKFDLSDKTTTRDDINRNYQYQLWSEDAW